MVKEESKLSAQYRKLGEYVFKLKKESATVDIDFEENTIAEIDRLLARIEAIKSKYEYVKSFSNFKSDEVRDENKYIDEWEGIVLKKKYIDLGTKVAYFEREGEIPLVLLHGWGANIESVVPIINAISPKYHVYAYDSAGFGDSEEPREVWGTHDYEELLERFLSKMNIERATFVGHSFGGKTLSIFAAKHPEMVDKLVLVDASGVIPKRSLKYYFKVYSFKFLRKVYTTFSSGDKDERLEKFYKKYGSDDYQSSQGIMRKTFVKVVNESTEEYFEKIKAPTLLVWGETDDATPLYMAKVFEQKIKDSGLVVLNGGHFSYIDDYGTFSAVLKSFLG